MKIGLDHNNMKYAEKSPARFHNPPSFQTLPFPICSSNQPLLLKIYFWISIAFTKYLLLVECYYLYNYPNDIYSVSGIIVSQIGALGSIVFFFAYRVEARNLFHDACSRLHRLNPGQLRRINSRFKMLFCFYLVYVVVIMGLQLVTDPVVMGGPSNVFNYVKLLVFDYAIQAPDWAQYASAWGLILGQNLLLFLLSGYLVMLASYLSVIIASIGDCAIQVLDNKGIQYAEEINDYFLVFVTFVNRLNSLMKNLLMLWFTVTLYASCNNVIKYISERNGCNSKSLNFKLPSLFHDMFNLAILTFMASNLPAVTHRALDRLLMKSKSVLSLNKYRDYLFLREQFKSGPYGLKIGGMFFITTRLYVSYLGLGVTYAVIYIQLNPMLLRKLQGLDANYTAPT